MDYVKAGVVFNGILRAKEWDPDDVFAWGGGASADYGCCEFGDPYGVGGAEVADAGACRAAAVPSGLGR